MLKPILFLLALAAPVVAFAHNDDWPVRDTQTIEKSFPLSGQPQRLAVDNLQGYVHIVGTSSSTVHIVAHKIIRAETDADLAKARAEVKLDMTQDAGSVSVYYDATWRCNHNSDGCHDHEHRYYDVTYDIDVELPMSARLDASTVSGGIKVDQIHGPFKVSTVNGSVAMSGIGGPGSVTSVNGPIKIAFTQNPAEPCTFKTVNGGVEAYFQPRLNADLFFKTLNGEVLADFDVAPLTIPASVTKGEEGARFVYHRDHSGGVRAGSGGPKLDFETVNGSIRLHTQH